MLYDREQIKAIIPHREPFLLLDEVEGIEEGTVAAIYRVTGREDFFKGHFPGYPVMPGVLVLESLAQAGAVALLRMEEFRGRIALFAGADEVKWKKEVKPGDTLRLSVRLEKIRFGMGRGFAEASVDGTPVCTAVIKFAVPPGLKAASDVKE